MVLRPCTNRHTRGMLKHCPGKKGREQEACGPVPQFPCLPQVAMGYAHSLVIARDETDAEKEKLRKLPEYNPRTI